MVRRIKRLFARLFKVRVGLAGEIIKLVRKSNGCSKRYVIEMLHIYYPKMFSKFEVEYTLDELACNGKLITDGYHYVDPEHNPDLAKSIMSAKKQLASAAHLFT